MEFVVKRFEELTTKELYQIYKTRVDVFVVEQECPYPEIDEMDLTSIHIYLQEEGSILAYCRLIPPGIRFEDVAIGRVLSTRRREGIATKLLEKAIEVIQKEFDCSSITLEAQVYARKLYENVGFVQTSEEFLEDGIPHIQMRKYL
ncbi:MAG: GNAT family N-acetyltransferase [Firmicutes bacterium]|nr:GNAT family N-acetyltransferase [Bacillota bacterium]